MSMPNDDRYLFEYPDEAGYPDGSGTLTQDQKVLIDDVYDDHRTPAFAFGVVDNEKEGIYEAFVGDRSLGGITYSLKPDRIILQAAAVYPEFRHQGIATDMIRQVLDDIRRREMTATIMCPIVRSFIEKNPEYADLINPDHPGVMRAAHR